MKRFCICSLRSHLNVSTFSPLTRGYSEGLDAFRFFFKQFIIKSKAYTVNYRIISRQKNGGYERLERSAGKCVQTPLNSSIGRW